MSWVFNIYFTLYMLLSILGLLQDIYEKNRSSAFVVCTASASLTLAYLMQAYKTPALLAPLHGSAPIFLAAALSWDLRHSIDEIKELQLDKSFSMQEKYAILTIALVLCAPAWLMSGMAAFELFPTR